MNFNLILTIVVVLLLCEIKDFFLNGGFAHVLAFNLLKIILLAIGLAMMVMMHFMVHVFPLLKNEEAELKQLGREPKPQKTIPVAPKQEKVLPDLDIRRSF